MAAQASDVAAMARQIERLVERPAWQGDASIKGDLMRVLSKLTTVRVDVELLKRTGIGKWVKKLTKYDDDVVRGYSLSLTEKWKAQVGVASEKPPKRSGSSNGHAPERVSAASPPAADTERYESARKKLQEKYAAEKAKREARTVQVLNKPISKRRGTTISAAPSRSSLAARANMSSMQKHKSLGMSARMTTAPRSAPPAPGRRPLPSTGGMSRPTSSLPSGDEDEARRRRRERLLALAQQGRADNGEPTRADNGRRLPPPASQRPSSADSGRGGSAPQKAVDPRKAMLDKMFPRVCGVSADTSAASRSKKAPSVGASTGKATTASGSKKKPVNYTEGQREVIQWLKNLDADMSNYAQAFFDNGFDSIKLLSVVKSSDLASMVPKAGHQRMIEKALNDLKMKHMTAASSRPRSANRDRDPSRRKPRRDSYFDEDSDDSFVVSDGDEYAPGVITAMLRKGRKRRYSIDSTDSYNMEASFDEIQHEEERSKRIGEYEDYREELRNKKLLKKK